MADSGLIVFTPSGRRGRFPLGTPVLDAARELGVDIDSVCGGRGLCGRCQVSLSTGEFAKLGVTSDAHHLSEVTAVEARYASRRGLASGRRLSCQATVLGDVVIDVPAESQVHRQIVRKRAEARKIEIDPVVRLHYVEVAEPDMHEPASDLRRLQAALEEQWGLEALGADLGVVQNLQRTLRRGGRLPTAPAPQCAKGNTSSMFGPAFTTAPTGSPWMSARRRSPPICAICRAARWSRPRAP